MRSPEHAPKPSSSSPELKKIKGGRAEPEVRDEDVEFIDEAVPVSVHEQKTVRFNPKDIVHDDIRTDELVYGDTNKAQKLDEDEASEGGESEEPDVETARRGYESQEAEEAFPLVNERTIEDVREGWHAKAVEEIYGILDRRTRRVGMLKAKIRPNLEAYTMRMRRYPKETEPELDRRALKQRTELVQEIAELSESVELIEEGLLQLDRAEAPNETLVDLVARMREKSLAEMRRAKAYAEEEPENPQRQKVLRDAMEHVVWFEDLLVRAHELRGERLDEAAASAFEEEPEPEREIDDDTTVMRKHDTAI
jgi:hypothetical protein